jgi:hypothetical protein
MAGFVEDPVRSTQEGIRNEAVRPIVEQEHDPSAGGDFPGGHDPSEKFLSIPIESLCIDQEKGWVNLFELSSLGPRIGQEDELPEVPIRIRE